MQEFTKVSSDENVFKERGKTTLFNKLISHDRSCGTVSFFLLENRMACFVFCCFGHISFLKTTEKKPFKATFWEINMHMLNNNNKTIYLKM